MSEDNFAIKLTGDQALVLSDWLHSMMMGSSEFNELVNRDRAVWSPLYAIAGSLDKSLVEVFRRDYRRRLEVARERLLDTLGDVGRPTV
ncbi:hypothetical protein [Actinoplanes sp. HUAS TT8]|uniref:hypothetical protein n=1 Tax=Actinoplanes sp. HUAS TT8 TaxID=3447453 RepID=UPI003F528D3F